MNIGAGTTTLRTGNYIVARQFGMYRIYHKLTKDFVGQAPTMRQARNMIRSVLKGHTPTTEGIE